MTNVFGYEFSALNSLLISFLSGFFTISLFKRKYKAEEKKSLIRGKLTSGYLLFLAVPFLITLINSLLTYFCSFTDGFLFYIILTFPSVIIGGALGMFCSVFFKKLPELFFILIYTAILLIPLLEFYFNPQIYFYNPLFGFFPGTIYDEGLSVDFKLLIYRLLNLFFFGGMFFFLYKKIFNEYLFSRKVFLAIVIASAAIFISFSSDLGFSTNQYRIKEQLNVHAATEHFDIFYPHELDETVAKAIILSHEYYYEELKKFLNEEPDEKITSYVFISRAQKKELFGSANADVAKPWRNEIYTVYDNYSLTLKHELAHCFFRKSGKGIFKIAGDFNPSLIEGAAVAADPFYDENFIHHLAAVAYANQYKVNIEDLFKVFNFFSRASSLSYVAAGSFCRYLADEYGIEKFKQLYSSTDFEKIYNKNIRQLSEEYYSFIKDYESDKLVHKANYYFGRSTIFSKACARYVSSQTEKGWKELYKKNYKASGEIFDEVLKVSNDYSALVGKINVLIEEKKNYEAAFLLKERINEYSGGAYYYNLELKMADLNARLNNFNAADSLYRVLSMQNPGQTLFYLSNLRTGLLTRDTMILTYLEGTEITKYLTLQDLNSFKYNYGSFPVLIELAKSLKIDYPLFIRQFDKTLAADNFLSSYGIYKLSIYMAENLDFRSAKRMAALSMRYKQDKSFNFMLKENFNKIDWLSKNYERIFSKTTIENL